MKKKNEKHYDKRGKEKKKKKERQVVNSKKVKLLESREITSCKYLS